MQPGDGSRFGPRVTASEIAALQETAVPANTKKNTSWAVWNEWSAYRRGQDPSNYLLTMQVSELNEWLSRFVVEVRRKDGKFYPPNTLHQLCCGLLRRLREVDPSLDIFKNPEFDSFRKTLDAEMKRFARHANSPQESRGYNWSGGGVALGERFAWCSLCSDLN